MEGTEGYPFRFSKYAVKPLQQVRASTYEVSKYDPPFLNMVIRVLGGHPSLDTAILCPNGIPESLVPVSMFITRYLAVFHSGSNTLMPKVLLQ